MRSSAPASFLKKETQSVPLQSKRSPMVADTSLGCDVHSQLENNVSAFDQFHKSLNRRSAIPAADPKAVVAKHNKRQVSVNLKLKSG